MPAYKNIKLDKKDYDDAVVFESRDWNRYSLLAKLKNGYYFMKLRSVYSGPKITKTIRFMSEGTMVNIVAMWMKSNRYTHLKFENDKLMATSKD
jgi:hypothetical protein